MTPTTTSAISYVRVSTDKQDTLRQQADIAAYCHLHHITLIKEIEEPEAKSGRSSAAKAKPSDALAYYAALCQLDLDRIERPGYADLITTLGERDDIQLVIVSAIDRISRDAIELLLLERILAANGARLVAISNGGSVDTIYASGWLQYGIQALLAEHECRQVSDRTSSSLRAIAATGKHIGAPPYGWHVIDGQWQHHPEQWPDVERAYFLRHNLHYNYRQIAQVLGISKSQVKSRLDAYEFNPSNTKG